MSLVNQVIEFLQQRRENLLSGKINCIPSPFSGFRKDFVGIEQETYYCITAAQKCAKSQFTSFMFIYTPILYAFEHQDQVRVKIFYAPLEESKEKIVMRFMRFLMYQLSNHQLRITHHELTSAIEGAPVSEDVLKLLESPQYKAILDFFEEHVTFLKSKNPTGKRVGRLFI